MARAPLNLPTAPAVSMAARPSRLRQAAKLGCAGLARAAANGDGPRCGESLARLSLWERRALRAESGCRRRALCSPHGARVRDSSTPLRWLGMTRRGAAALRMTGRGPPRAPGYCMAADAEAALGGIALPLVGQAAVRRAPAQGAPKSFACARPLHRRRDRRPASPFPDSSPPTGERIKERGGRTAQAESKAEGGRTQRLEVAPAVPPHPPLSPQGERERRTRIAHGGDRSGGTARGNDSRDRDEAKAL